MQPERLFTFQNVAAVPVIGRRVLFELFAAVDVDLCRAIFGQQLQNGRKSGDCFFPVAGEIKVYAVLVGRFSLQPELSFIAAVTTHFEDLDRAVFTFYREKIQESGADEPAVNSVVNRVGDHHQGAVGLVRAFEA